MQRRYFEHLYNEICVAVNRRVSRYDLWLLVWDGGGDPDDLTRSQARDFVENRLSALLLEEGTSLRPRARRRLERRILRFDPRHPTPEEWLVNTFDALNEAT
jgi:hypothetical protein